MGFHERTQPASSEIADETVPHGGETVLTGGVGDKTFEDLPRRIRHDEQWPTDGSEDRSIGTTGCNRGLNHMGFHTFPIDRAEALRDPSRYKFCSREELLGGLPLGPESVVADLGSGTGFYTDDVAPFVGTVHAVDVQSEMHEKYREQGVPDNVDLVTAGVDSLPFADGELDGAYSTMTHHEYASEASFAELARVLRAGGRLVTVDWSADGDGESGPPTEERFTVSDAADQLRNAGFTIEAALERPETFYLVARR